MAQEETRPDLGTPERNGLRDRLFRSGAPQLAEAYEAAVRLLHTPDFPARRHLLSHLVRDIANGLPEVVTGSKLMRFDEREALDDLAGTWRREVPDLAPFTEPATPIAPTVSVSASLAGQVSQLVRDHEHVQQTHVDKTALLMEALRPGSLALRASLEPIIREFVGVVGRFTATTHVPRPTITVDVKHKRRRKSRPEAIRTEGELTSLFKRFEDGLRGLMAGHFEVTREIGTLLESCQPSADALERVRPFLGGAEQLRYFFEHPRLEDPAWLSILDAAGFFAHPPTAIVQESPGGTSTRWPGWPASGLLARLAANASAQEAVLRIAVSIPDTDNPWVHRDLADAALLLEPSRAAKLVPRLLSALSNSVVDWANLDEKLGALTARLAESGERETALALLRALLAKPLRGRQGKPSPLDPHDLRRILADHLNAIVSHLGNEALTALCEALEMAIRSWSEHVEAAAGEDRSEVWRPAIEHDGRFPNSTRDVLVGSVVRAAELWVAQDPSRLAAVIEQLESRRWRVFRRIALFLLASAPGASAEFLGARLLDREQFDSFDRTREYRLLLRCGFARLNAEQQRLLLAWIDAGPDSDQLTRFLERWADRAPTGEDVAWMGRRWQWRRLAVVQDALGADSRTRFAELTQEFDAVDSEAALDVSVWPARETAPKGPQPLDSARLFDMPAAEIAARVRLPWPERGQTIEFFYETQMLEWARSRPERFAEGALHFQGCPADVLAHLFWGLRDAVREGRSFNWSNVLRLASWALAEGNAASSAPPTLDQSTGTWEAWQRLRAALADLLHAGFPSRGPAALTIDQREAVWPLIESLAKSPEAGTRARAVDLIVFYRWWIVEQSLVATQTGGPAPAVEAPEVRQALSAALTLEATPEVHEAFGRHFAWLAASESAWVREHLTWIFPQDRERSALWEAAWDAYLNSTQDPGRSCFEPLQDVYATAIERLELPPLGGRELMGGTEPARERAENLARHLMRLWADGTLDAMSKTALVDQLFSAADARLRETALRSVGWDLERQFGQSVVPAPIVERLKLLWERRRKAVERQPALCDELPGFGSWFVCGAFDDDWALGQLDFVLRTALPAEEDLHAWSPVDATPQVMRRLARLAAERTPIVVRCLATLARQLKSSIPVSASLDEIKTVLAAGLRSNDPATQAEALEAFHRLGSLGFRAQELLPFSNDLHDPVAIPYFTWDHPMTVAEIRKRLAEASEPERDRLLGQILREAKDTDVWKFTSPDEVLQRWPRVERHVGKRRAFWQLLLGQWKEQGLLAG